MNSIQDVNKEYLNYCENYNEPASDEVKKALHSHSTALDEYICAVCEDSWKNGFNHAMHLMQGGGVR